MKNRIKTAQDKKSDDTKFLLRIPPELHEAIKAIAEKERRSMNGEIVYAIEKHLKCKEESREVSYG